MFRVPLLVSCPLSAIVLSASVLTAGSLHAATPDPEWPCIQAFIPEVALAVMWPEPLAEADRGQWRNNSQIAELSQTLGDLEAFTQNEEKLIADFVAAQAQASLASSLNNLADGVVTVANRLRTKYISGIKRYTRQQISIAGQIEQSLNQLAAMGDDTSQARTDLEESLQWHERVYDQREQAITALCDRPVELEEKLSSVLRELSRHLP